MKVIFFVEHLSMLVPISLLPDIDRTWHLYVVKACRCECQSLGSSQAMIKPGRDVSQVRQKGTGARSLFIPVSIMQLRVVLTWTNTLCRIDKCDERPQALLLLGAIHCRHQRGAGSKVGGFEIVRMANLPFVNCSFVGNVYENSTEANCRTLTLKQDIVINGHFFKCAVLVDGSEWIR